LRDTSSLFFLHPSTSPTFFPLLLPPWPAVSFPYRSRVSSRTLPYLPHLISPPVCGFAVRSPIQTQAVLICHTDTDTLPHLSTRVRFIRTMPGSFSFSLCEECLHAPAHMHHSSAAECIQPLTAYINSPTQESLDFLLLSPLPLPVCPFARVVSTPPHDPQSPSSFDSATAHFSAIPSSFSHHVLCPCVSVFADPALRSVLPILHLHSLPHLSSPWSPA